MTKYLDYHKKKTKELKVGPKRLPKYFRNYILNETPSNEELHEIFYSSIFGMAGEILLETKTNKNVPIGSVFQDTNYLTKFFDNWSELTIEKYRPSYLIFGTNINSTTIPIALIDYYPLETILMDDMSNNLISNVTRMKMKKYYANNFVTIYDIHNENELLGIAPVKNFWNLISMGYKPIIAQLEDLIENTENVLVRDRDNFNIPILKYLEDGKISEVLINEKTNIEVLRSFLESLKDLNDGAKLFMEMNI